MYLALLAPAFIVSPGLLQKIYGARDDRAVRLGVGLNALGLLAVCRRAGAARHDRARALFPDLPTSRAGAADDADARRAAAASAPRPGGGVLGRGQRRRRGPVHADDVAVAGSLQAVRQSRGRRSAACCSSRAAAAVACGAIAVALAIASPSVIGALGVFYTLLGVSLFVPILAGLYLRRAGTPKRSRRSPPAS